MSLRTARRMDGVERTLIRQVFDAAPRDAINLGLGQPDLKTPPRICLAGIEGIALGKTSYTATAGDRAVRAAVAKRYAPFVSGPESVLITIGSQEAVFAVALTLVDSGDEILYPDPGYPGYPVVARLVGAQGISYPLRAERRFRLDAADVVARLTRKTRLVIVCSPSNPTGAVDRANDLEQLARELRARGVAWLSDEIYAGFAYDGPIPSLRAFSPEGGLVVAGLSKDLSMTGWRIGWAVGPAPIVERVIAAHQYLVTSASSVSQAAALAALAPESDAERQAYLEVFRHRRDLMAEGLSKIPGIEFHIPEGAFYFFVDISRFGPSIEVCRRILERRNVITIPGVAFGPGGEGYMRISYAASDDDIVRGIEALRAELATRP